MAKLTRRDYLKQMAAASAIVGASKLLSPASASAKTDQGSGPVRQSVQKPKFHFTPTTPTAPGEANLIVLFGGIMGISNTNNGVAQVGFQKGTGKHKLAINLYQKIGNECHQLPPITNLGGVKTIELEIAGETANVNFFHEDTFKRDLTVDNPKDFGWVLDFEDSLLYPDGVAWTRRTFQPVLKLRHGTFYTHQLTKNKFNLVEANNVNNPHLASLNQVPQLVGAAINIPAGKKAVLKVGGAMVAQFGHLAGLQHQVQFMNECLEPGGGHCKWHQPTHANEAIRNDFYMHYLMFKPKNPSAKKCGVIPQAPVILGYPLDKCPPATVDVTDEAPCMATGFGQKTEFPVGP